MSYKQTMFYISILICLWPLVQSQRNLCRTATKNTMYSSSNRRYELQCCPGYVRDTTYPYYRGIKCKPVCVPPCQNSYCSKPGECLCDSGYIADPLDDHNCLPSCPDGCPNGFCVSPEVCGCNHGYNLLNNTCIPVCTEPCDNGFCKSPENCECNPGYRKSEKNICEPYCSVGCNNGLCVSPETCACEKGWYLSGINTCSPICSIDCTAGCTAPNECTVLSTVEVITDKLSEFTSEYSTDLTTVSGTEDHSSVENTTTPWITSDKKAYATSNASVIGANSDKNAQIIWFSVAAFLVLLLIVTAALVGRVCYIERKYHVREPQEEKIDTTSSSFNITFSSLSQK